MALTFQPHILLQNLDAERKQGETLRTGENMDFNKFWYIPMQRTGHHLGLNDVLNH